MQPNGLGSLPTTLFTVWCKSHRLQFGWVHSIWWHCSSKTSIFAASSGCNPIIASFLSSAFACAIVVKCCVTFWTYIQTTTTTCITIQVNIQKCIINMHKRINHKHLLLDKSIVFYKLGPLLLENLKHSQISYTIAKINFLFLFTIFNFFCYLNCISQVDKLIRIQRCWILSFWY